MRFAVVVLTAGLFAAPAAHAERSGSTPLELTLLAAAETSLVLDAMQTFEIQRQHRAEQNPLIGAHPGGAKIVGYFALAGAVTAAATYYMPKPLRLVAPIVVLLLEVPQVERNLRFGYQIRI